MQGQPGWVAVPLGFTAQQTAPRQCDRTHKQHREQVRGAGRSTLPWHNRNTLCNNGGQDVLADRHCSAYSKPRNMQSRSVRQAHNAGQVLQRHHSTCSNAREHLKLWLVG